MTPYDRIRSFITHNPTDNDRKAIAIINACVTLWGDPSDVENASNKSTLVWRGRGRPIGEVSNATVTSEGEVTVRDQLTWCGKIHSVIGRTTLHVSSPPKPHRISDSFLDALAQADTPLRGATIPPWPTSWMTQALEMSRRAIAVRGEPTRTEHGCGEYKLCWGAGDYAGSYLKFTRHSCTDHNTAISAHSEPGS